MLRSARESRGLDRARIERDTRIRERYLSALERGAYDELPGDVYARGFLRTYATYLGLDPDAMTALYRLETRRPTDRLRRPPARLRAMGSPQPHAFVLAPGAVAAAILTVLVGALVAYLAYQLITFARTPELRVIDPAGDVRGHRESSIVISGVTEPNARVSVSGLAENPSVVADAEGGFSVRVQLVPGSNLVTISALDPRTTRQSAEVTRTIEVVGDTDAGESRRRPSAQRG
ncbi:MAG: helix-turn-helix domain-containing protein [Candidatus Limnocylindria bacterium]